MSNAVEETLVLVKPDGVARNLTGEILRRIEAKGYSLVDLKMVTADRDLLSAVGLLLRIVSRRSSMSVLISPKPSSISHLSW